MRRAFKDLKASKDPQVTTFCLSNSNEIYIKTILEVRRLICSRLSYNSLADEPCYGANRTALQRHRRV